MNLASGSFFYSSSGGSSDGWSMNFAGPDCCNSSSVRKPHVTAIGSIEALLAVCMSPAVSPM